MRQKSSGHPSPFWDLLTSWLTPRVSSPASQLTHLFPLPLLPFCPPQFLPPGRPLGFPGPLPHECKAGFPRLCPPTPTSGAHSALPWEARGIAFLFYFCRHPTFPVYFVLTFRARIQRLGGIPCPNSTWFLRFGRAVDSVTSKGDQPYLKQWIQICSVLEFREQRDPCIVFVFSSSNVSHNLSP